jgi:exosortase/archaeosortase family protein
LSRRQLFFWLVALATLNAFAGIALRTWIERGPAYSLFELFGVSAILWLALAACLGLLNQADVVEPIRAGDRWIAALVVLVALLPVATASGLALSALALHMIATGEPGSAERRAGIIALAITSSLIWGRLLLAMFDGPMLAVDSALVARVAATAQSANVLALSDGSARIVVAPGCSSWQGMSLALVFWATVNQWYRVPFGWRAVGWCAAALAATMAINVARISAMILFPAHLEDIHTGYGWHVSMWLTLAAVCGLCLAGARHEAFRR